MPAHLRALHKRGYYFDSNPQAFSVLYGSAAAAERRLSILGYSRARAEEAWNSAKAEVLQKAEQDGDGSNETLRRVHEKIANLFDPISYKEWQTRYAEIQRAKANGGGDNSADTFIFLRGLDSTEIADDPLMWVAIQLYAVEPTELWADISYLVESESETKESIFGEDEIPSRLSHAFGKITLLTEGVTDSRILKASLSEFYPEARDLLASWISKDSRLRVGHHLLRGSCAASLVPVLLTVSSRFSTTMPPDTKRSPLSRA